jgi:LPS sulfotransferase NodH
MPEIARERFDDLYGRRRRAYAKDASGEEFLRLLNEDLHARELALYRDYEAVHPFLFVVGLPRSGTTLLSQLLSRSFGAGFIDNVAARFWLAPVHGIRLSRLIVGEHGGASFESDYARTKTLGDIHEFGYFWRYWLQKHTFEDIVQARAREDEIDWQGLRSTLVNIQHEFERPFVAKNMLGAYHMPMLRDLLGPVVFVYVERDPLDVSVSILEARRRYYEDLNTWWSYVPVEYPLLEGLGYWEQIAGQVHYLARFYERALAELGPESVVRVTYEQMCRDPRSVLDAVVARVVSSYGYELEIVTAPPESFPFREHEDRRSEKETFQRLHESLRAEDG